MFSNHQSLKYIFKQRDINMRQRKWMEFLEDYDFTLHYHLGKANVVVDALSRKSQGVLASVASQGGRYSRLWDSLDYSTVIGLRVRWGV